MHDSDPEAHDAPDHDLRGSFVAVLAMAAFFILCWGGVLAIALVRR